MPVKQQQPLSPSAVPQSRHFLWVEFNGECGSWERPMIQRRGVTTIWSASQQQQQKRRVCQATSGASESTARFHRLQLESVGVQVGIQQLGDWYRVPAHTVAQHRQGSFLRQYNSSLYHALREFYPEHAWQPWRFVHPPKHMWDQPQLVVLFLQYAERELSLSTPLNDWLHVSWKQLVPLGASRLYRQGHHLATYLSWLYPHHDWDQYLFTQMPPRPAWWSQRSNRLRIFNAIVAALGFSSSVTPATQWYRVQVVHIRRARVRHGAHLVKFYNNSICEMLLDLEPQHADFWLPWLFQQCPPSWWKSQDNVRRWLGWVMLQMGYRTPIELQSLTYRQWKLLRGRPLLGQHGDSPLAALRWALPELNIQAWNLRHLSRGKTAIAISQTAESEREYLRWLGSELGVSRWPEDWYSIAYSDVARVGAKRGGSSESVISGRYGYSLPRALSTLFPEISWDLSAFCHIGKGSWDNIVVQKAAMERLATQVFPDVEQIGPSSAAALERWYDISPEQISKMNNLDALYMIVRYYDCSLVKALTCLYPDHQWIPKLFKYPSIRVYYKPTNRGRSRKVEILPEDPT